MIQDIAPHTYHNEYKPSAPDKNSFIPAVSYTHLWIHDSVMLLMGWKI